MHYTSLLPWRPSLYWRWVSNSCHCQWQPFKVAHGHMQCLFILWQVSVPGTNLPSVTLLLVGNKNIGPSWGSCMANPYSSIFFGEWRFQRLTAVHETDGSATAAPLCFWTCLYHPQPHQTTCPSPYLASCYWYTSSVCVSGCRELF